MIVVGSSVIVLVVGFILTFLFLNGVCNALNRIADAMERVADALEAEESEAQA